MKYRRTWQALNVQIFAVCICICVCNEKSSFATGEFLSALKALMSAGFSFLTRFASQ